MHCKLLIYELCSKMDSILLGRSDMKSTYLKTSLYTILTTTLLLCSSQNYAQQYYKWMDKNGSTHYTTTPPPKGAKRLDKVATYGNHQTTQVTTPETQAPQTTAPTTTQQPPQNTNKASENTQREPAAPSTTSRADR